jgi:hypothetical protein
VHVERSYRFDRARSADVWVEACGALARMAGNQQQAEEQVVKV